MSNPGLGKALIVDDEKTNRLILKSLLVKQGYQTIEAVNGQEAVDLFHQEAPSIIFMDVMMPGGMDGLEATRSIKNDPETNDCKIIMLTAKGQAEDKRKGTEAGADDYFVKPFSPLDLITKVEEVLES